MEGGKECPRTSINAPYGSWLYVEPTIGCRCLFVYRSCLERITDMIVLPLIAIFFILKKAHKENLNGYGYI